MSKPEINMIVCVAENNLIGDKIQLEMVYFGIQKRS